MTSIKQKALRLFYPLLMKAAKGQATVRQNRTAQLFQTPIYNVPVVLNTGAALNLHDWKGHNILIVNTASECGYTGQYAELQQLQTRYPNLRILGVPSNDFKGQEPGTDEAIAAFCRVNYGVTFPLAQKSTVLPGAGQHPLYQWLSQPQQNGWNAQAPRWNFSKYLVNEQGVLTHYFDAAVSPLSNEVRAALER